MNEDPFKEYIQESEPSKRDKGYAWHTAIGLQAVDGFGRYMFFVKETQGPQQYFSSNIFVH